MTEVQSKRELNKAKKRAEIVMAASDLFLQNGYGTTSMSAISEKIGGSKATLWGYFSSKEELFIAVIDHHVNTFSKVVEEVIIGKTFSKENLRRACIHFLDALFHPNSILIYRLVISEGERFPEIKEAFYGHGPSKLHNLLTKFFETRFDREESLRLTQLIITNVSGFRTDVLLRPTKTPTTDRTIFVDNILAHLAFPTLDEKN